jgi:predicted hotdog family 3-hydroxylacyl-ACP dehydratase
MNPVTPTSFPDVASLIPHRATMVLIDRVVAASDETLCTEVLITPDNIFFDPATNSVGAWLGIEMMAQTIAAFAGYQALRRGEEIKLGFLLGSRRYESHCAEFPVGCLLQVQVQCVLQHENGLGAFECRIVDSTQRELAHANVTVFRPDDVKEFLTSSESTAV